MKAQKATKKQMRFLSFFFISLVFLLFTTYSFATWQAFYFLPFDFAQDKLFTFSPASAQETSDIKAKILETLETVKPEDFAPDQLIIKYKSYITKVEGLDEYHDTLIHSGILYEKQEDLFKKTYEEAPEIFNIFVVETKKDFDIKRAVGKLNNNSDVEYAEPNYIYHTLFTPNDPYWNQMWGMQKIQADSAWDINSGNSTVIAAIVDTGVDPSLPEFSGKMTAGYDFVDNDNDPRDCAGHGTHVAGTVAAITNNALGVVGVAGGNSAAGNTGVRIMPVRVLDCSGSGSMSDVASGIRWAADNGADTINLSLGGPGGSAACSAVDYAWSRGVVVAAAAANDNVSSCSYPALCSNSICVVATTSGDSKASFSNYGTGADVGAPGVSILSTTMGGSYASWNGTSMATPHVAGLAALLFSLNPGGLTNAQVRSCLENNVDVPGGWSSNWGKGRINALKALQDPTCNTGVPTPTPGPSPTLSPTPTPTVGPGTPTPTSPLTPTLTPTISPTPTTGPTPTPIPCSRADVNGDGKIDSADITQIINNWGARGGVEDVNQDGIVNGADLSWVFTCWGQAPTPLPTSPLTPGQPTPTPGPGTPTPTIPWLPTATPTPIPPTPTPTKCPVCQGQTANKECISTHPKYR